MKYYAGIGSRDTEFNIQQDMGSIARVLAIKGFTLRSGGARGADQAFELGCDQHQGRKEIFLPWERFENNGSHLFSPSDEAIKLASTIHPVFDRLSYKAKLLIARNMHQILGESLNDPVDFVLCWTDDGAETEKQYSRNTGGTGSAIVLASRNNIPVFNLKNNSSYSYVVNMMLCS